jgi:hypothetical protein
MKNVSKANEQARMLKVIKAAQARQRIRNAAALKFNSNSNFMKNVRQYNQAWANALQLGNNRRAAMEQLGPGRARILNRLSGPKRTPNMEKALQNVHDRLNFYLIEYNHPLVGKFVPWRSFVAKTIRAKNQSASPRKNSPVRRTSSPRKPMPNYRGSIPGVRNSAHLARLIAAAERKPKNTANLARQLARMGL